MKKDIIVCGDVHGLWRYLNTFINKKKPKLILQCGDWGWWPRAQVKRQRRNGLMISGFDPFGVKPGDTEIYFAPGNHEDWDELSLRKAEFSQLMPNVWCAKRGATLTLPDGRVVLFMGGAASIDKNLRTPGVDWFPQEMIPISELYKLEESGLDRVDIVISHTCPQEFNPLLYSKKPYAGWQYKFYDSSQEVLSEILHLYKPALWYFGHFHVQMSGYYDGTKTKWFALNEIPETNWWRYLSNYGT